MSDYEAKHRHRCPCGAEFEVEGSRIYTESTMKTLVGIHQTFCLPYQEVTAKFKDRSTGAPSNKPFCNL